MLGSPKKSGNYQKMQEIDSLNNSKRSGNAKNPETARNSQKMLNNPENARKSGKC